MIRVQVLSDLHLEWHRDLGLSFLRELDGTGVDVLVAAGDICHLDEAELVFGELLNRYAQVIYCPGNHEFWDRSIEETEELLWLLEEKFDPRLAVFYGPFDTATVKGQRFVGGTMWYPQPVGLVELSAKKWPDFRYIKDDPEAIYEMNRIFSRELNRELHKDDVVVTHHAPSRGSIHPFYAKDPTNHFYMCDQEELIMAEQPKLWIHGHMHNRFDYKLGETRVICNPLGRPDELASTKAFDLKLIVEV